jgi:hypothetical protein
MILSCAQSSAICCSSRYIWAVELPIEFLSKTSNRLFPFLTALTRHCRTAGSGESRSYRSSTLADVPGEITADVFAGRRSTYLQFGFFAVSPNPRRSSVSPDLHSRVHKFVDDFEICVAKTNSFSGIGNRPVSMYFVFCSLILSPAFAASAFSGR